MDIENGSQKQKQKRGFEAIPNLGEGFDFAQISRTGSRGTSQQPGALGQGNRQPLGARPGQF
jgi:hypothetical protein